MVMPGPSSWATLRQQRGRSAEDDTSAQPRQQQRIGASHPGVEYIADDGHRDAVKKSLRPVRPGVGPRASSMVLTSSRAWEGCSLPSPALSTGNPVACSSR